MNYVIEDRNGNTVAVHTDKDEACRLARIQEPDGVLIGTIYKDGKEAGGFLVGQLPANFGM
jgi:hypothetical protein